jgi:phosphoribosylglycinamide formyltransferase-1
MKKKKIAIFISGRGSNMKAIVEQCKSGILKDLAEVLLVFSNKEDAVGLVYAQEQDLETQYIVSKGLKRSTFDQKVLALLEDYTIDYIVLAGYMRVLSLPFVKSFEDRIINVHPADTTQHQGLEGYEWAFDNKLDETKITVHLVDGGLDTGSIIGQHPVDLRGADTLEEVQKRGLVVEHHFYSEMLKKIFEANFSKSEL